MFRLKHWLTFLLVSMAIFESFGWGAKGHQIIASVGADLATDGKAFWQSNLQTIRALSTVPDRVWKSPATRSQEAPTHFFEIDTYYSASDFDHIDTFPSSYVEAIQKYTESRVVRDGTAPWRIRQLYRLALQSMRSGDMKKGLQYVGVMSHYVGDLSQPLHVSENYDGQLTGNKGIHQFFETTVIIDEAQIRSDVRARAQKLLQSASFTKQFESQLMNAILQAVERSIVLRDKILNNDHRYGRSAKGKAVQLELAKDRMADGAATFTMILNHLWRDSGLEAKATPLTVQDPSWVQPNFRPLNFSTSNFPAALPDMIDPTSESIMENDCSL